MQLQYKYLYSYTPYTPYTPYTLALASVRTGLMDYKYTQQNSTYCFDLVFCLYIDFGKHCNSLVTSYLCMTFIGIGLCVAELESNFTNKWHSTS